MKEPSEKRLQPYAVDLLILLGLWLLFFWRILVTSPTAGLSFASGDFSDQFYAFARYEAGRLLAGELPLWNPYTFAGHPFLADIQAAIFYPISLLAVIAGALFGHDTFPYRALELEAMLHFLLAAIFTYLLVRRLTASRTGGLVAAVVFTFGGYLASYPPLQLAILEVITWLPLVLLFLDVAGDRLSDGATRSAVRWVIAAGLALGVSTLAGHPQSTLFVLYGCLAFALFRFFLPWRSDLDRRKVAQRIGLVALFLAIGLGLAAVQLLPSLEFMRLSTRASASFDEMGSGFTPYDLIQLVLPAVGVPFPALYVGILPLGLAAAAVLRYLFLPRPAEKALARNPRALMIAFWSGIGLLALLLSFGRHLPVYQVFYLLAPGWRLFRHQERVIVWMVLAAAVLAGYGATWLVRSRRAGMDAVETRLWRGLMVAYALATVVALAFAAVFFLRYQTGNDALWGFAAATLFLALMLALAMLAIRSRRSWLLLGLIVLDLFTITPGNHRGPAIADPFSPLPVLAAPLADPEPFRVANEDRLPANYGVAYGLEEVGGASPLRLARYQEFLDRVPQPRAWQLLNVTYVLSARDNLDVAADRIAAGQNLDGEPVNLFRLADTGRRAWLVDQAVIESDPVRVYERLAADDFDPYRQAILPQPLADLATANGSLCNGNITWLERRPEQLALAVTTGQPCLLVLSELDYPGWQATVDGVKRPILRANGLLRALSLSQGEHQIEMRFRPPTLVWGAVLTLVTLLLAALGLVLLRTR